MLTHAAPSVFKWNTYIIIHVARVRMIHTRAFRTIAIVACYWDEINNKNLYPVLNACCNDVKTNEPNVINTNETRLVKTENMSINN